MALWQELTNQGRVIGGHLAGGSVQTDKLGDGGLSIQHPRSPFKRHTIKVETVADWEELQASRGVTSAIGQAAAKAGLPGRAGMAVGAGLGAALNAGHTVRIDWIDGKQSIVELPAKQFMLFALQLKSRQTIAPTDAQTEAPEPASAQPGVTEKIVDLASAVVRRAKPASPSEPTPQPDVLEQMTKLAAIHEAGILTDEEYAQKKAELLSRL